MEQKINRSALLEAVLFAEGQPVKTQALAGLLGISEEAAELELAALQQRYQAEDRGLQLMQVESSWILTTKPLYAAQIRQALTLSKQTPISRAAMEALAIIAYKQPISKGYVDSVRGVDSGHLLRTLLEKGLIEEAGRLDIPGRPIIYRTTELFLRSFQLTSLAELPPLPKEYEQYTAALSAAQEEPVLEEGAPAL